MGLLQRLNPFARKSAMSSADLANLVWGGAATASGASVTARSALQVTTVLACARVIAEGLAQVPLKIYRERADGGREAATEHPLYRLLWKRPNEWQTSYEFRETLGLHMALCGNAYVFVNRVSGKIVELLPFEPGNVTVKRNDDFTLDYRVTQPNGRSVEVPRGTMWHLRGPSWNAYSGLELFRLAREAIGLAIATEETSATMANNGARIGGVLKHPGKLSEDAAKRIRESWEAIYAGKANAGRTAVLEEGLEFVKASMSAVDADLLNQRKFQIEEIARAMRIFPAIIGYSDKASTYASAEQFFLAHVVHSLGPWYARIEQSIDVNLIADDKYFSKFEVAGLLRGDKKAQAEWFKAMFGIAVYSPNDIRKLLDENPYEGGDRRYWPTNMLPTDETLQDSAADDAESDDAADDTATEKD